MDPRAPLLRGHMVFQKHLCADQRLFSMASPNSSSIRCFASVKAEAAVLLACQYLATTSGVSQDHIYGKDLLFSPTASLTTGVHRDVIGLLPLEAPLPLRPRLSVTASAMEALNFDLCGSIPPTSKAQPQVRVEGLCPSAHLSVQDMWPQNR